MMLFTTNREISGKSQTLDSACIQVLMAGPQRAGVTGQEGLKVNPKLKQLMKELGEAINESLSESEQISEVIARIKSGGYDVFLVLEATIGFNKITDDAEPKAVTAAGARREPEFKVNSQDMKFLKSLKISLDDAA